MNLLNEIKQKYLKFKKLEWVLFVIDCYGCVRSIILYCFSSIKKPGTFYGFHAYFWACRYADKRTNKWSRKWNQAGRKQGVFAFGETNLIVCSAAELKLWKKLRAVNKNLNPRKAIKRSYYATSL